jgi:hypothetical protein
MDPAHHGLGVASNPQGELGGAGAMCEIEQGEGALAGAGMRRVQGQRAQILRDLTPVRKVNT